MNRGLPVAAFAASASVAFAQDLAALTLAGQRRIDPVGYPAGYEARSVVFVYDVMSNAFAYPLTAPLNCSQILEDVSFSPGPWSNVETRLLTRVEFVVGSRTGNTVPADVLMIFWNRADVDFAGWSGTGTSMVNPAATPVGVLRFAITDPIDANTLIYYTSSLTGLPGGGLTVPGQLCVQEAWVTSGFVPASYADLSAGLMQGCAADSTYLLALATATGAPAGGNPALVGATAPDYGRDISNAAMCPNIGWFAGAPAPASGGDVERRASVAAGVQVGLMVRFSGLVSEGCFPPCPCCRQDFDADGDAGTDADIEAFFACLGGDCCAACPPTADFDCDGDIGTDADIEAFFRVLGGGVC